MGSQQGARKSFPAWCWSPVRDLMPMWSWERPLAPLPPERCPPPPLPQEAPTVLQQGPPSRGCRLLRAADPPPVGCTHGHAGAAGRRAGPAPGRGLPHPPALEPGGLPCASACALVPQACLAHRHRHGKSLLLSTAAPEAPGMALSPGQSQDVLKKLT